MNQSVDKRKHNRIAHRSKVRVTDEQGEEYIVHTQDLSHGGLFIRIFTDNPPQFGTKVTVQALDIEEAIINRATVVRVELGKGIAVEFMDD